MPSNINLITCVNQLGFIGEKGGLLYRIPADLLFFKETTMDSVVIMGYKTYAEIGKALPRRENVVVYNPEKGYPLLSENVHGEPSYQSAIDWASKTHPTKQIFVIGGESLYKEAFQKGVDFIYLTFVHDSKSGDTSFIQRDSILSEFHIYNTDTWEHRFNDGNAHGVEYSFHLFRHNKYLQPVDAVVDRLTMKKYEDLFIKGDGVHESFK